MAAETMRKTWRVGCHASLQHENERSDQRGSEQETNTLQWPHVSGSSMHANPLTVSAGGWGATIERDCVLESPMLTRQTRGSNDSAGPVKSVIFASVAPR